MSNNSTSTNKSQNRTKNNNSSPKAQNSGPKKIKAMNNNNQKQSSFSKEEKAPVSVSITSSTREPKFTYKKDEVRIEHSELVETIHNSAVAAQFSVLKRLRCNPGSQATFRWLSTIAGSWETYKFEKLKFRYLTRCSTSTDGSALMVYDYDGADQAILTENEASTMAGATEASVWKNFECSLNPSKANAAYKQHFNMDDVRFATTAQDQKTIDCAQFSLCSDNAVASKTIGKLWVDYTVILRTPQPVTFPPNQAGGAFYSKIGGLITGVSNPLTTNTRVALAVDTIESGLLKNLPVDPPSPAQNFAMFAEDFKGIMTTVVAGTGLASGALPLINGVASGLNIGNIVNTPQTFLQRAELIEAKAGDILGYNIINGTTATSINSYLGSANPVFTLPPN
jgi:hypothetical protein